MALGGAFGFLGIHCFMAKRYVRGVIMLLLTISFLATFFIFPPEVGESTGSQIRNMFEIRGYLFPGDLLGFFALGLWVWDFFGILFGQFKYPIVPEIGE